MTPPPVHLPSNHLQLPSELRNRPSQLPTHPQPLRTLTRKHERQPTSTHRTRDHTGALPPRGKIRKARQQLPPVRTEH
ncbi:hypothetical protein, partial [Streptomyces sp. NPDC015414]|uniref:hypothetical protein n=1 Tax=Streptomyces sp. NPDC015414 TaxID=3364957 RepID=UPI0036F9A223